MHKKSMSLKQGKYLERNNGKALSQLQIDSSNNEQIFDQQNDRNEESARKNQISLNKYRNKNEQNYSPNMNDQSLDEKLNQNSDNESFEEISNQQGYDHRGGRENRGVEIQSNNQNAREKKIKSENSTPQSIQSKSNLRQNIRKIPCLPTEQKEGELNEQDVLDPNLSLEIQNLDQKSPVGIENELDFVQAAAKGTTMNPASNANLGVKDQSENQLKNLNQAWREGGLRIIMHVKQAHEYFLNLSRSYKFKRINENQLHILGDLSTDYNYFYFNDFLNKRPSCFSKTINNLAQGVQKLYNKSFLKIYFALGYDQRPLAINPESFLKILWDIFIFVLLLVNIFYIPIKIAFEQDQSTGFDPPAWLQFFLNDIPSWVFLTDIFINFLTCYYEQGILITDFQKISRNYLKTGFFWDFLVILPFFLRFFVEVPYIEIILLFRINQMAQTVKRFQENVHYRESESPVYDMIKLVFLILFVAHFCGCSFYWLQTIELKNDPSIKTWITVLNLADETWLVQYVTALYWAVITMITVGYGDITPVTVEQRLFLIVMSLLSCGVFAYSVNCIGTIFKDLTKKNQELKQKMHLAIQKMQKRGLEHSLIMQVRRYFQYKMENSQEESHDDIFILNELDQNLKKEVLTDINFRILREKKLFANNFTYQFLLKLAPLLKEFQFSPEEVIFKKGDTAEKVYFLVEGEAALTLPILVNSVSSSNGFNAEQEGRERTLTKTNTVNMNPSKIFENTNQDTFEQFNTQKQVQIGYKNIKLLYEGDMFGQESFFSQEVLHYEAIALTSISVICLQKADFLMTLREFQSDYERFCLLRDSIIISNRAKGLDFKCFSCDQFDHGIQKCPVITYVPPTDKFLAILNRSENQERSEWIRRGYKSEGGRGDMDYVKETMVQFIIDEDIFPNLNEMVEKIKLIEDPPKDEDIENQDGENQSVKTSKTSKTNKTSQTTKSYERRERQYAQRKRGEGQRKQRIFIKQPSGINQNDNPGGLEQIQEEEKNFDSPLKSSLRPPGELNTNSTSQNTLHNFLSQISNQAPSSPGLSAFDINREFNRKGDHQQSQGINSYGDRSPNYAPIAHSRSKEEITEQIVSRKVNKLERSIFQRSVSQISSATSQNDIDSKTVRTIMDDNLMDNNQKEEILKQLEEQKRNLHLNLLNPHNTTNKVLNVTDSFDIDLIKEWVIYQPLHNINKIIDQLNENAQQTPGFKRGLTIKQDQEQLNLKNKEEIENFRKNFRTQVGVRAGKKKSTIRIRKVQGKGQNDEEEGLGSGAVEKDLIQASGPESQEISLIQDRDSQNEQNVIIQDQFKL